MEKNKKKATEEVATEASQPSTEEILKELEETKKKLEEAEAREGEEADKYLRILAEYDNFRKRTIKEREQIYADAYADAVKQLLPVVDNVERSLEYATDEKIAEGMRLIINSIHQTLEKMGVKEIETKVFDPNVHNAVMHIDDESYGEDEIIEVFQKGYILNEKVIRYAMVKVAN